MLREWLFSKAQVQTAYIPHTDVSSAARLRGFEEDLHLKGQEFATLLSILYVGWVIPHDRSIFWLNFGIQIYHYADTIVCYCLIIQGSGVIILGICSSIG